MVFTKNFFTLLAVCLFMLYTSVSDVHAGTYTAASCSYEDVSSVIDSASPGDTINVPSGSCTWTSGLSINKGINLFGAGIGNTTIKNGRVDHGYLIGYNPSDWTLNTPFRISGFTFDLDDNGHGISLGSSYKEAPFTVQTKVRIDHNKFINAATLNYQALRNTCTMNGVFDNNITDGVWYPVRNLTGNGTTANQSWYQYRYPNWNMGNSYTFFYEDNQFLDLRDGENVDSVLMNGQNSAHYVVRYNTITCYKGSQNLIDFHGFQNDNPDMYGCFGAEIYGNDITSVEGSGTITLAAARSGKSMIFYNSGNTTGTYDSHYYVNAGGDEYNCPPDYKTEQLIHDSYIWGNKKNKSSAMDNIYSGTQCDCNGLENIPTVNRDYFEDLDPVGITCGTLGNLPATCTVGQGYWATEQSCSGLTGMVGANPTTPISGTLYKCTSTNTWTEYYTPYTYPHPLREPSPPQRFRFD